jgi:hypothetical protein
MSRKLGAIALALAVLVAGMGLKTLLSAGSGTVLTANGPDPVPTKNPWPKKPQISGLITNGPDPVPTKNPWPKKPTIATLIANGPDPVPTKNPWPKKPTMKTSVPEVR